MMKIWINRIKSSIFTINSKNIIRKNRLFIILTLVFGIGLSGGVVYGSSEPAIETPESLIEKLSGINLQNDNTQILREARSYLQINEENNDIVTTVWLEQKKQKFIDYISSKIILDENLPIYSQTVITGIRNYASDTFNSINVAYTKSMEIWANSYRDNFLNIVLDRNSKRRYKDGEKAFLEFFNKIYEENLVRALIENFRPMIDNILREKINNSDTRCISFSFIRRMTDCIYNENSSGLTTNAHFNKRMSNVFSNSGRLIRNLFAYEFIKGLELFDITDIPIGEIKPEEKDIFEYSYHTNDAIVRFKPKENGINSGFIINVVKMDQKTENILQSFYVKKYYGSTKVGSENMKIEESTTFSSSAPVSFVASKRSISKKSEWKKRKFNMKEPFLYGLLKTLKFSPEVKFFINPYTIDSFYIATKNLSDDRNSFLPLSKVTSLTDKDNERLLNESLNQLDFISRFLRLRDLHNDNFGFIVGKGQQKYKSLAIIDFAQPTFMESYVTKTIQENFLKCTYSGQKNEGIRILSLSDNDLNETEKFMKTLILNVENKMRFSSGFHALQQFNTRIESAQLPEHLEFPASVLSQVMDGEEPDDKFDTKLRDILALQSQNIKNLMLQQRGTEDKPEEIMLRYPMTGQPRTNAELIGFKSGKKPEDADLAEGHLDYIEDAFEDLDNYCQGVMCNYKALKKFITDGYNKYFDEQGNLKVQPVALAE